MARPSSKTNNAKPSSAKRGRRPRTSTTPDAAGVVAALQKDIAEVRSMIAAGFPASEATQAFVIGDVGRKVVDGAVTRAQCCNAEPTMTLTKAPGAPATVASLKSVKASAIEALRVQISRLADRLDSTLPHLYLLPPSAIEELNSSKTDNSSKADAGSDGRSKMVMLELSEIEDIRRLTDFVGQILDNLQL